MLNEKEIRNDIEKNILELIKKIEILTEPVNMEERKKLKQVHMIDHNYHDYVKDAQETNNLLDLISDFLRTYGDHTLTKIN
jgi:DNA polymerase III delta prime subunit